MAKKRIGRPPRSDSPTRIAVLLPGTLRAWLARRARIEGRAQGDVIADALGQYRARLRQRGGAQ